MDLTDSDHKYDNGLRTRNNSNSISNNTKLQSRMPRKEHQREPPTPASLLGATPQQFLLKFIERNFERRQIDQQSFCTFNKFASILGKELEKKTGLADVEGFVTMVRTVFLNFEYLNRSKNTFVLYLQLLEICMTIFEKAVSLDLSREICCEMLDILWPLYETSRKEEPFTKMEDKFSKITMPKQLTEPQTMVKINEMVTLPPIMSSNKYQTLIALAFRNFGQHSGMHAIIRAFMSVEGETYLDSILQILIKCMEELDSQRFAKVFKVYLAIGDSSMDQSKHLSILLTKVLASKNKLQFIYQIFLNLEVEKLLQPNYLFFVSITALDCIFTDRAITQKTIELIRIISRYLTVFKRINHITENDKFIGLYNKVITVLLTGKKEVPGGHQDPKSKKARHAELLKQKLEKLNQEDPASSKKFSFIHELANQLSLGQLEDDEPLRKEEDSPLKSEMKLQALKPDEVATISTLMKKIFLNFFQNPKLSVVAKTIYSQEPQKTQFLKLCSQNIPHIAPQILQLILSVYIPLLSESPQLETHPQQAPSTNPKESSLMKIIKLHMLEYKIEKENIGDQEIYRGYYRGIHDRLVGGGGTNFDFLALTILHQYIDDSRIVIEELVRGCLDKIETNSDKKASYFRCNIALIASILDLHHNIVIKLSYNRIKMHINKLNSPFMVQDFLSVSEIKENKLFVTGPRIELSREKESELQIIRQFITKLFTMTDKLGQLINLSNSEQNSYYYMILIQLCTLCMQKIPQFGIQSAQIQSIIKLRKNNKYSLAITISNQIGNVIRECPGWQGEGGHLEIGFNQRIVLLHLFVKMEMLFYQGGERRDGERDKGEIVGADQLTVERLEELDQCVRGVLKFLGNQPNFQVLKLINKGLETKDELTFNQQLVNFSFDEIEARKNKLKQFIKHFHIIKFYSEASASNQILLLMIIKTGLRLLEKIWEKLPAEVAEESKKDVKDLKLLYDSKASSNSESERKTIQAYVKLRLLGMTSESSKNKLSLDQIKSMTRSLEENHDEVSKLIISEQNKENIAGIEELFSSKTNFIAYLLEQIIKSENESSNQREISLLTLNLLKTLIDNNSGVLEIAKKYTFQTLENSEAIPVLVLTRTKKSVQYLKELQKSKSIQKLEHPNESLKPRICEKEEQKILQESKKIYLILSKMLYSLNNLKAEKEKSITKMVESLIELDQYSSIYISVYIMREIINIAPILKNTLSKESFHALTDRFFGQLMALREIYEGVVIELGGKNNESTFTISTIINFFVDNFYTQNYNENFSLQLTDSLVLLNEGQKELKQSKSQQKSKEKKFSTVCLMNQKKSTFKCIKCDPVRQICMNCVQACHKDHPIIYIQASSRVSKSCQCSEDTCKINPLYEKKKEGADRKKNKIKEPVFYKRGQQNNRAYMEEFGERGNEYLGNMIEDDFDEEESFNFMLDIPNSQLIRPGNQGLVQAVYRNPNDPGQSRLFGFSGAPQPYRTGLIQQPAQIQAIPAHNIFTSEALNEGSEINLQRYNARMAYELGRPPENQFQNMVYIREERQRERERRERELMKEKERQRMRDREKEQMKMLINESRYGLAQYGERLNERVEYVHDAGEPTEEQDPNNDRYYDEDYEGTEKVIENKVVELANKKKEANQPVYDLIVDQSYLLPIFMNMTVDLCENKAEQSKEKEPQINWHIKLINPIIINPGLVHTSSKMCAAKSFVTRLAKSQGSFHPSPCVSRAPLAVSQKFVFILSGPKISVHLKQQLFSYLLQKNGTSIVYNCMIEQHLQFQPHSISVGHKNMVVVAGLHQLNIFEYEQSGQFTNRNNPLRHTINNDNINKIKLTKFGIFVGLNREVRLLSHSLQIRLAFKIPDALIKEWYVMQSGQAFTLYVTCSQGYIFYAEGNLNSTGEINLIKKINDSRTNRPVGVFTIAKSVEGCGNLLLSTYKDKNIGHCLGRLASESTLTDLNYIKLNNQGLDPILDKYNIIGLSDMAPSPLAQKQQKQLFIISILKEDRTYDVMGVHKGLLAFIRLRQDIPNGPTKYEVQLICGEEERCEFFEVVWFEDRRYWVVLSMSEDGGLRITVPVKIGKAVLEKELAALKDKKLVQDRGDNGGKKVEEVAGSAPKSEESQVYQKLCNSIKEQLNIKTIKQSLQTHAQQPNSFLPYLQTSQILRQKQQYSLSTLSCSPDNKTRKYELKLLNKKKIITGLSIPESSDVVLPTRKIQNTFQVAFTHEESLYFYAFGVVKFQVRKVEDGLYNRDNRELKRMAMMAKNRDASDYSAEERMFMSMSAANLKSSSDIAVYGEVFETVFKAKVTALMAKIEKFMNANNPFDLSQEEKLQKCLKNCNLLLSTSLQSNNSTISPEQSSQFLETLRSCLITNKKRQQTCNRLYPHIKKCLYKTLLLHEQMSGKRAHIFNDTLCPLRYCTETKIQFLYQALSKGEINDQDLLLLVDQLYGIVCGAREDENGAVNEKGEVEVFLYYVAKYPAMLFKIYKKIKVVENAKMLYRVIPLYIYTYITLKFLGYHLQWILPALYEAVGKCLQGQQDGPSQTPKPSILSRFILYKYLKEAQNIVLEGWLRNVQGTDAKQCMKEVLPVTNQNPLGGNNFNPIRGFGGMPDFGLIQYGGQFEMEDEETMIKKAIEESEREAARMNQLLEQNQQIQPQVQGQNLMQSQQKPSQFGNLNPLIKDLIDDSLKQLDYQNTNISQNSQKATIFYILFKLALSNLNSPNQSNRDTFYYLCHHVEKVIQKLCAGYQQVTNPNTHGILVMWLNLFGIVARECHRDARAVACYQGAKECIMAALSTKFKIENIKKLAHVPNLFARRLKGQKPQTKAHFIYGLISVLQRPCQANFVLLTLGCYWLFPHNEQYYNKTKYIETIRENQKTGNINKIYETAISNLEIWKEVGDPDWLERWVEEGRENWTRAMELLALYYQ